MQEVFDPVALIHGDFSAGLILLCDHATNELPPAYGDLGIDESQFERHIAYDIGARAVTVRLAERLGVPAVMTTFSRLLVDPNRGEDDPTVVMRIADGTIVPGNHPIGAEEIENRLASFHRPYHAAVDRAIDQAFASGVVPALFSVHSFTPSWHGRFRPWQVALLWDKDPRFTRLITAGLARDGSLSIGDNEPYDGALKNDTLYRHGTARGLAHALIEIRQDLIGTEAGATEWAERLHPVLRNCMGVAELHEVRHFGSRTGHVDSRPNPETGNAAAPGDYRRNVHG